MTRYIVGFLLALGLIIVVIVLIIRGLSGGPKQAPSQVDLSSYATTGTTVQLTIDSPVTAPDNHRDIIINIGNNQSTLRVTKGYDGETVRRQAYPMTTSAYDVFLRSINAYGFTDGNNDPNLSDERGHCSLGDRYIFEIIDEDGSDTQHYWHTTCNSGTFKGNVDAIKQLFVAQIPDYGQLTGDVNL